MSDGALIFDTEVNTGGLETGLRAAQNQTSSLSNTAQTAFGNLAANAARDIANAVKNAFKEAAQFIVSTGSSFESSMSQVGATMGITSASKDYEKLSAAAKEMGATTKYSATQAGEALNYLALAGYTADEAVSALPTVLNVAAAGGIDLAYSSDMITDSMSALGLEMGELEGFSDKLAKTSQKSNTSVAQLGEAILTVGGTAKTLSGGVDELNTMLGLIADNGIKGAEGGTLLRNIILSLSAPTDNAAAALEQLNVQAFDNQGNLRDLSEVFGDLNNALAPLTEQEKTQFLNEIFNKVDLKGVNALLGTSAERFDELRGYIEDCDGAASQMADTMSQNLEGDLQIMNSSLEAVGVSAYEKFSEPLRTAVQEITGVFDRLNSNINGELGNKLETLAEKLGDIAVKAAEFAVDEGLPKLIDGLEWICDNGDELISAAEGAAAMVIAYKGLSAANTAATAISSLATAMSGAATATEALGIAMNALPIVAVGALAIGGIVALSGYMDKQKELIGYEGEIKEAYNEANKEIAIQNNQLSELAGSSNLADRKQAYETAKSDIPEMEAQYEKNARKLYDLKIALSHVSADIADPNADPELYSKLEQEIAGLEEQNIFLENALSSRRYIVEKYRDFDIRPERIMNQDILDQQSKNAADALKRGKEKLAQQTAAAIASQEELNKALSDGWEELDHKYAIGIISDEKALYDRRLGLLAEYGDESNTEHWKYYEQIYSYEAEQRQKSLDEDKKMQEERESSLKGSLNDINAVYQQKFSELETMQNNYRSRLMAVGGEVFTAETQKNEDGSETKTYRINEIDSQIKKMQSYHEDIKKLKEDGAGAALLSEINSLSSEDGARMADYIANLSDSERAKIIELYAQKEKTADELSADLYASDAEKMQNAFASAITDLGVTAYEAGSAAAEQFASGFNGSLSELINISAAISRSNAAAGYAQASPADGTDTQTSVNVDVNVTGGNITLDGNAVGEYTLNYTRQSDVQKGK